MEKDSGIAAGGESVARTGPAELDGLSPEQRAALWSATHATTWRRHAVDLQFHLPLIGSRLFFRLVGGGERRAADRLQREQAGHPVLTRGNLLFVLAVVIVWIALGIAALSMWNHVFPLIDPSVQPAGGT